MTTSDEVHDVVIVGAGPAGLAAARNLRALGLRDTVVLDREPEPGGVPRHCAHLGYGLREFGRMMTGPGFAQRTVAAAAGVAIHTNVTVTRLRSGGELELSTPSGPRRIRGRRVLLATGVRETPRPPRLVSGTRPWGVLTTGALQQFVYLARRRPFERAVIVGSELVSFSALLTLRSGSIKALAMIEENARITARRPGDLIARCLFGVPILTSTRLVAIAGGKTVEGVVVERDGVQWTIACDGVVFTGRFIPDAALLHGSHLALDPGSGGPLVDQYGRCSDPCYFAAGNLVHPVETAGRCYREGLHAASLIVTDLEGRLPVADQAISIEIGGALRYVWPQRIVLPDANGMRWHFNARAAQEARGELRVRADGQELWSRRLHVLPERRLTIPASVLSHQRPRQVLVTLESR